MARARRRQSRDQAGDSVAAQLSHARRARYDDLGYAVIPDLFDADEAAAMRLELERMLREGKFWDASLKPTNALAGVDLRCMGMRERSPLFAALTLEPRLVIHPATIANGTMHVIPRSHHAAVRHEQTAGTA